VQPLRRDVEVDAAVGGRHGEAALGAERRLVLHRGLVVALDPDVGLGRVGVAVADVDVAQDVAELVHVRRIRSERILHVRERRQRLVLDRDELRGPSRLLERLGGDDGHGLAGVADDLVRQHGLVRELQSEGARRGKVGRCEDACHAGRAGGACRAHTANPGAGARAADGDAPEHVLRAQVAPVRVLPEHLRHAVDAARVRADATASRGNAHATVAAAKASIMAGTSSPSG
jgi:hypothetical protein